LVEVAGEKKKQRGWVMLPQPGSGRLGPGTRLGFGASRGTSLPGDLALVQLFRGIWKWNSRLKVMLLSVHRYDVCE